MNNLSIIGNLTADATLVEREVAGVKTPVCSFTVAANYGRRNAEGNQPVQYVRCTLWRDMAKNIYPYLKKGIKVFVMGPASVSAYISTQDRGARASLEIRTVTQFDFLSPQKRDEAAPAAETPAEPQFSEDDGFPFV